MNKLTKRFLSFLKEYMDEQIDEQPENGKISIKHDFYQIYDYQLSEAKTNALKTLIPGFTLYFTEKTRSKGDSELTTHYFLYNHCDQSYLISIKNNKKYLKNKSVVDIDTPHRSVREDNLLLDSCHEEELIVLLAKVDTCLSFYEKNEENVRLKCLTGKHFFLEQINLKQYRHKLFDYKVNANTQKR